MEICEIYPPIFSTRKTIEEYCRNTLPVHIYYNLLFFLFMLVLIMCFIYMMVLIIC